MFATESCYSSSDRSGPSSSCASSSAAPSRPRRCTVWTACRRPSCGTRFPSATGTRWSRPSPTGWPRLMNSAARHPPRSRSRAPDPGRRPENRRPRSDAGLAARLPQSTSRVRHSSSCQERSKSSALSLRREVVAGTLTSSTDSGAPSFAMSGSHARSESSGVRPPPRLELVAGHGIQWRQRPLGRRKAAGLGPALPDRRGAERPPRRIMG